MVEEYPTNQPKRCHQVSVARSSEWQLAAARRQGCGDTGDHRCTFTATVWRLADSWPLHPGRPIVDVPDEYA